MKPWEPESEPHTSKKKFPFHSTDNNPIAGGRVNLGRKRPTKDELNSENGRTKAWAEACDHILKLVDAYNKGLLEYKKADPEGIDPGGAGKKYYKTAADALRNFLKKGGGHLDYFVEGFFVFEAIESQGFLYSVRIVGMTKEEKTAREGIRHEHSSSSLYSIYSC